MYPFTCRPHIKVDVEPRQAHISLADFELEVNEALYFSLMKQLMLSPGEPWLSTWKFFRVSFSELMKFFWFFSNGQ